ncbi:MAG TPA: glycosyltransferase [Candidatus Dormibacteraeota bacterium]
MRALFTVQPSTGHLHPLVPVARALEDAGHEVAVCSSASFREDVQGFGLTHIAAGLDWLAGDHSTWTAFPPMPPPGPEFARFVVTVFADVTTSRMVPDLLDIARDWRPDIIIREHFEFGGCLAAEVLRIPHASIGGNAYSAIDSPEVHYFPGNRLMVADAMTGHRTRLGLPPDPEVLMPFRKLHLVFTPPSWDAADAPRPPNIHRLRHTSTIRPGARLDDWVGQLRERPTVLASLGTVFNNTPGVLEAIVAGLAGEPVNLIVAIGRNGDPDRFGSVPENVRLEAYVEQPLLLAHCDAFVTHGGFNSVKEAASLGVPMVVVPITADQPYSAQRCVELGIGRAIGRDNLTADAVHDAVVDVLNTPSYRDDAKRFQAEMNSLPGTEHLVALIEESIRNVASVV